MAGIACYRPWALCHQTLGPQTSSPKYLKSQGPKGRGHRYPQSTLSHPIQQLIKSTDIPEDGSINGFIGYGVHIKGSAGQFKRGSLFTLRDQDNNSFLQIETIPQTTRKIYLSGINALIATISCVSEI